MDDWSYETRKRRVILKHVCPDGSPRSFERVRRNCPGCGKAVEVPGGPEALFWLLLGGGVVLTLGVAGAGWLTIGPVAGLIALGAGGAAITLAVLAS